MIVPFYPEPELVQFGPLCSFIWSTHVLACLFFALPEGDVMPRTHALCHWKFITPTPLIFYRTKFCNYEILVLVEQAIERITTFILIRKRKLTEGKSV